MRLFEAMRLGVAPIIASDDWVYPRGPDWSACSVVIKERHNLRCTSTRPAISRSAYAYMRFNDVPGAPPRSYVTTELTDRRD